jgi:hypothetical protein
LFTFIYLEKNHPDHVWDGFGLKYFFYISPFFPKNPFLQEVNIFHKQVLLF